MTFDRSEGEFLSSLEQWAIQIVCNDTKGPNVSKLRINARPLRGGHPTLRFDDDVVAMTRAAGATRYAAVTVASRQALTTVGPCEIGDILGLVDGDIVVVGREVPAVAREILSRMLSIGGELVTLVTGADATTDLTEELPDWLARAYPVVEVVVYEGGQPLWPIIMGVE